MENRGINIREYKALCNISNKLKQNFIGKYIIASQYLHVLNESPLNTEKYYTLFKKDKKNFFLFYYISQFIQRILFLIFKILKDNIFYKRNNIKLKTDFEILIVSHITNLSHIEEKTDFYFGNICNRKNTLTVLLNHTNTSSHILNNSIQYPNKFVLTNKLSFSKEILIFFFTFVQSFQLIAKIINTKKSFEKEFLKKISLDFLGRKTAFSIRTAYEIEHYVKKYNPKIIITTYEGYPWERLTFYLSKKVNKNILCLGYQHSTILRNENGMRKKIKNNYDPDYILTTGKEARNILLQQSDFSKSQIKILGSNRKVYLKNSGNKYNILVLPQGTIKETLFMFDFSISVLKINSIVNFIWRLHPLINIADIIRQRPHYNRLSKRITVSQNSLENDLKISKWAFYRGSAAIIQSVSAGVIPIYIMKANEINHDPLFNIQNGKHAIMKADEINKIIKESSVNKKLINYCNNFYQPLNNKILDNLLHLVRE